MEKLTLVQGFTVMILPVLFAITLHEVAHGWVAKMLGDRTAEKMGRLSLNPLHHIDPIGTLLVPGVLYAVGGIIFGWAKPVPVDFGRLRKPRRDMVLVAVAGPAANLLMALAWALIVRLAHVIGIEFFELMGSGGISINLLLMLLNLLPIPPLDGGRIALGLLPPRLGYKFGKLEPYGFFILLVLIATGLLSNILGLPLMLMQKILYGIAGI
ncbi:site-2 protease family protein [Methylococcus sp. EFPC2]|uniref:site-2 protease family protein n=1 Tax=Methylococcus sp. EFPC2 TaxID=2812648 RepID=UPI001967D1DF|nr:site-2 protease family protein [Methylococcus sp. EFPC2]QSA98359.1 site-2 protease family protein [Methylococcus sp. EFPC2]